MPMVREMGPVKEVGMEEEEEKGGRSDSNEI